MNYFEFYDIPISFIPDEAALKKTFYALSKQYHPDFYTLDAEEVQADVLQKSTLNNDAYQTLKDFDKRMKYILELKGVLEDEGQNKLDPSFLMEVMDINEQLMELELDFDEKGFAEVLQLINEKEKELEDHIQPILENYEDAQASSSDLALIKDFYFKKRYLLRIKENLGKFAP